MSVRNYYEELGISTTYAGEVKKLNNRLKNILDELDSKLDIQPVYRYGSISHYIYDSGIVKELDFNLGETGNLKLSWLIKIGSSEDLLRFNFLALNLILDILEKRAPISPIYLKLKSWLLDRIKEAIDLSGLDIGYTVVDARIIKSGAGAIDQKLVTDNLAWLKDYKDSHEKFRSALVFYVSKKYPDSITNAYSALEGLVKVFLNSDARLDKPETRNELISKLGLDKNYGNILYHYSIIAHEFSSRHGKKDQESSASEIIEPALAEFYIYLTGSVIRLISQKMPKK